MAPSKPRDRREFVRMSVGLPRHPKLLDTSDPARCGWLMFVGIAYAREHLTDGILRPDTVVHEARVPRKTVRELVRVGIWHDPGHGCGKCAQPPAGHVVVHDYAEHNQTSGEVEQVRDAARAAAEARWGNRGKGGPDGPGAGATETQPAPAPDPEPDAGRDAERIPDRNADRMQDCNAEAEAEAEVPYLLTLVSRLAGKSDARTDQRSARLPAHTVAAWQEIAGPHVDLEREARQYLAMYGDRPANNERKAWLGHLLKARDYAATQRGEKSVPGCRDCTGGWDLTDPDRPRPCPKCKPHLAGGANVVPLRAAAP